MSEQNLLKKIFIHSEDGKNIISWLKDGIWHSMILKNEITSLKQIEEVVKGRRKIVISDDNPPTFITQRST